MPHPRPITILAALAAALACRGGLAQLGQMPMAPAAGVANRAAAGLADLDQNGPGWLYYGVNAADRGLGYLGSYMTLGGYVPYAEDGLGGLWAADLRSHLSVNGGFFSNVGAVRKQFLGGSLLGIGIYWDFDGDQNQYPVAGLAGARWGQFGHSYNQVGVSGEWLTDFGNLRSNGYIPVGTTAHTLGAPGSPFTGTNLLCQYGLDAALAGTDLEVGAYVPGLSDWAGMVSVGGYAYGNARYDWWTGPLAGRDVVPWFGGVYTRLDMTFLENWDFSLQANNDSYFDWTGFARLTYRMGGSRRRNVPDQMEQPMMRNEHIVRGHQTPIAAVNPVTGLAWRVLHVDDTAATLGANGTAEAPFTTLAQAQAAATTPFDVVYVHAGTGAASPYESTWQFQADNQILVGEGSTLLLNTANCGNEPFFVGRGVRPVLTSAATAITLRNGAIVDHLAINDARTGIVGGAGLTAGADVNDVVITGTNGPTQVGVELGGVPGGRVNLLNMRLTDTGRALWVHDGTADVGFQGSIVQRASPAQSVLIQNMTASSVSVNEQLATLATPVASNPIVLPLDYGIVDTESQAAHAINVSNNTGTEVTIGRATIGTPSQSGVAVQTNSASPISFLDLVVTNAAQTAFLTENNDAASTVRIGGSSGLSSTAAGQPAFRSDDDATLAIQLKSLSSGVAPGTNGAIRLLGASAGTFTITESFLVSGTAGTVANDVTNTTTGPVSVTVP